MGQVLQIDLLAHGSKTLIIPALMGYVWNGYSPSRLYLMALLFAWLGDLFLIPRGTSFFITGIAAFWVTQLLYCNLMLTHLEGQLWEQLKKKKALLPLLLLGGLSIGYASVDISSIGSASNPRNLICTYFVHNWIFRRFNCTRKRQYKSDLPCDRLPVVCHLRQHDCF